MQARNTQSQKFPTVENLEMWDNQEDSIELTSTALQENSENGAVRIIFATYNEFDQLLVPSQRPNATLRFVNSKVISASLGKGRHIELPDPVKITLKHLKTINSLHINILSLPAMDIGQGKHGLHLYLSLKSVFYGLHRKWETI